MAQLSLDNYDFEQFKEDPFGLFLILSRYKFAAKLVKPGDSVLDLGCGRGIGTTFIAKFCREVVGIDLLAENIAVAEGRNRLGHLAFQVADAKSYAPGRQYNAVVSLDVIEHMPQEEARALLKTVKELLTGDGFAVIGTPNVNSGPYASRGRQECHVHEYTYQEFRAILEEQFKRVIIFSMTDEAVNTSFPELAWYFMAVCF